MSDLTAIDILIDPDEAAMQRRPRRGFHGIAPTVSQVEIGDKVLDFQSALLAAITPFCESGGTAAAFVADPGEEISPTIVDWVEKFVPDQVGAGRYFPHLTVGVATFDDLKAIEPNRSMTSRSIRRASRSTTSATTGPRASR